MLDPRADPDGSWQVRVYHIIQSLVGGNPVGDDPVKIHSSVSVHSLAKVAVEPKSHSSQSVPRTRTSLRQMFTAHNTRLTSSFPCHRTIHTGCGSSTYIAVACASTLAAGSQFCHSTPQRVRQSIAESSTIDHENESDRESDGQSPKPQHNYCPRSGSRSHPHHPPSPPSQTFNSTTEIPAQQGPHAADSWAHLCF